MPLSPPIETSPMPSNWPCAVRASPPMRRPNWPLKA